MASVHHTSYGGSAFGMKLWAITMLLSLAACSTVSVDSMRTRPADAIYTSTKQPPAVAECVVAAFNDDARGFEAIRFDGAKSYTSGDRVTVSALTDKPSYVLDITPNESGSRVEERNELRGGLMKSQYLPRFRSLASNCL